jgi:deoxyribonuclease IV
MMKELLFGTAGIPWSAKGGGTVKGIEEVKNLGLGSMELEFVHSVNITKEKAPEVKKVAINNNIALTCHGQYSINLNAKDVKVLKASVQRILNASNSLS